MSNDIVRYEVKNEQLRRYVKFFWELKIDYVRLNHKLIPQRNINLRLNLSDTPHFMLREGKRVSARKCLFHRFSGSMTVQFFNRHKTW